MQTICECLKEFHLDVGCTDTDVSLMQECVALAIEFPELVDSWDLAIATVLMMMDARQREIFRFDDLYPEAFHTAVFEGTQGFPILVVDEDGK